MLAENYNARALCAGVQFTAVIQSEPQRVACRRLPAAQPIEQLRRWIGVGG